MDIGKLNEMLAHLRRAGEAGVAQAASLLQGLAGPDARPAPAAPAAEPQAAAFLARQYSGPLGTRPYRLFIPSSYAGRKVPLLLMLHGCAQSPEDFAAGTRMNAAADAAGWLVAYPEQLSSANPGRCWNWFNTADQQRDAGEAGLLTAIVSAIAADFAVDPARVYAAGLSAGGAAAAVLGAAYPDVFAAIGVHSGLACGAASDMHSAMMAMQRPRPGRKLPHSLPAIVFHGDADTTVHPGNADAVIAQARDGASVVPSVHPGRAPGGRAFTRTEYRDPSGVPLLEHWVVTGAGHGWSGGSAEGSFTDPAGPDATAAMLAFFRAHPRRG